MRGCTQKIMAGKKLRMVLVTSLKYYVLFYIETSLGSNTIKTNDNDVESTSNLVDIYIIAT